MTADSPRREIERAAAALQRAIAESDGVDAETKELCGLMVAWLNGCDRCVSAHRAYALQLGVARERLEALFDYARSEAFTEPQRAALAAAVALTREPRALPDAVRGALRAHYDDDQIFEIVNAIALANYATRVNNALALNAVNVPCTP